MALPRNQPPRHTTQQPNWVTPPCHHQPTDPQQQPSRAPADPYLEYLQHQYNQMRPGQQPQQVDLTTTDDDPEELDPLDIEQVHQGISNHDQRLVQLITHTVSATLQTMQPGQRHYNHQPKTLEEAIPEHTRQATGLTLANLQRCCGTSDPEEIPAFWTAFNSAQQEGTRIQVLTAYLKEEQKHDTHMQFTVRHDLVRDLKIHKFHYPNSLAFINQGITPFSLQKLSSTQVKDLHKLEDDSEKATHVTIGDIAKQNQQLTKQVPADPSLFLELLATFRGLLLVLFGPTAPIYIDASELYHICLEGHHAGLLEAL